MMGLSDGRKSFTIGLAVLIQYTSVTATQPATQPPSQPPSHVAVAITLYAKASSAKMNYAKIEFLSISGVIFSSASGCFAPDPIWALHLVPVCLYCLNCTTFGYLILRKIIEIDAARCQILRLKCTKFDFGWGSAPHPAGGAYSAPPDPLAGFKGPTSKQRCYQD